MNAATPCVPRSPRRCQRRAFVSNALNMLASNVNGAPVVFLCICIAFQGRFSVRIYFFINTPSAEWRRSNESKREKNVISNHWQASGRCSSIRAKQMKYVELIFAVSISWVELSQAARDLLTIYDVDDGPLTTQMRAHVQNPFNNATRVRYQTRNNTEKAFRFDMRASCDNFTIIRFDSIRVWIENHDKRNRQVMQPKTTKKSERKWNNTLAFLVIFSRLLFLRAPRCPFEWRP